MPFKKREEAFATAAQAVRQRIAHDLGPAAARSFNIEVVSPRLMDDIRTQWKSAAGARDIAQERYDWDYIAQEVDFLLNDQRNPRHDTFGMVWRMDDKVCAFTHGRIFDSHVDIIQVYGAPGEHPLKGRVLAYTHTAVEAAAHAVGLAGAQYFGPFSEGSIKRIEQGDIPVTEAWRQSMWHRKHIAVDFTRPHLRQENPYIPGKSPPPADSHPSYAALYQKLFGKRRMAAPALAHA